MDLRNLFVWFLLASTTSGCAQKKTFIQTNSTFFREQSGKASSFRFPAEWEKHDAVWISWPTYENRAGYPTEVVHQQIIAALNGRVKVEIIVQDAGDELVARTNLQQAQIDLSNVNFRHIPHNDIWIRDTGPVFLKSERNRELKIADFNFNVWGYEDASSEGSQAEEQVDRLIAAHMNLTTIKSNMISEGGGLEFNGAGSMIAVESVARMRNPHMTLEDMTTEYKRIYNVEKVVWLKEGVAEDDSTLRGYLPGGYLPILTTNGHADEFVRFVSKDVVLLAQVSEEEAAHDPIAAITAKRMKDAKAILEQHFRVVPVPIPDGIEVELTPMDDVFQYIIGLTLLDGTKLNPEQNIKAILPTSYLNFFMSNGIVLAPSYWKEGRPASTKQKDEKFLQILRRELTGRDVVTINPENVNAGGGGIHCITQQQPAL